MKTETLHVENIKCGGCMRSIKDALMALPTVTEVEIDREAGAITISYDAASLSLSSVSEKLEHLGYPPAGQNSLANKAVSYVSCMIGRVKGAEE